MKMNEEKQNELIQTFMEISYVPDNDALSLKKKCTSIAMSDLSFLKSGILAVLPRSREFQQVLNMPETVPGKEGLYRVVFNKGINGTLAEFKDGSGYLGTVVDHGIQGQAHLIPLQAGEMSVSAAIPVDPMMTAMAIMLVRIDKKLDDIQKTQKQILDFLNRDKESKLLADLDLLMEMTKNYKFNFDNKEYLRTKLNLTEAINRSAAANINFYRKQIEELVRDNGFIHLNMNTDEKMDKLQDQFFYYRLALYLHAFSSFIEVLLVKNFHTEYLANIIQKIKGAAHEYQAFYTECYDAIDTYSKNTIETHVMGGLSFLSRSAGSLIRSIPFINETSIDEALIDFGNQMEKESTKTAKAAMKRFITNKQSDVQPFIENLQTIDRLYNKPLHLYCDEQHLYLNDN